MMLTRVDSRIASYRIKQRTRNLSIKSVRLNSVNVY